MSWTVINFITLAQEMDCCLMAIGHLLIQHWLSRICIFVTISISYQWRKWIRIHNIWNFARPQRVKQHGYTQNHCCIILIFLYDSVWYLPVPKAQILTAWYPEAGWILVQGWKYPQVPQEGNFKKTFELKKWRSSKIFTMLHIFQCLAG